MDTEKTNVLVLAYLGDSLYESIVREYLIKKNISNVNDLQSKSLNYVSAKSQARILQELIDNGILTDEELVIVKRGRNHKSTRHPKSCDAITYKHATAFETLIGYLHLKNKDERILEIMQTIFEEV